MGKSRKRDVLLSVSTCQGSSQIDADIAAGGPVEMLHRLAATTVVLAVTTACGSDGNSAEPFCDDLIAAQDQLTTVDQMDPNSLRDTVDVLEEINPPDEIADSYDAIVEVYSAIASDEGSVTDPSLATKFADIGNDIRSIDEFVTESCTDEEGTSADK